MTKIAKEKKRSDDPLDLKEVHKVWGPAEAQVVKGYLESNGIACVFRGQAAQSVHPFSANGMGEIKIFVTKKDYSLAKKLLEEKENL